MERSFSSFFMAGFECSSHRRRDGVRLDLVRATSHDKHVESDYSLCSRLGFRTLRDGLRWHLIEKTPGRYDWSSWMPALEAAERIDVEVIWDLFHYGSPDHVSQSAPDFPHRFTDFALAAVEVQQSVSGRRPMVCPLNEISFMSWAVEVGYFPAVGPREQGRFKRQLARTATTSARAIRQEWPDAFITWAEPLVHVAPQDHRRHARTAAERYRQGQFEAYDWLMGIAEPELGGDPSLVDTVGLNFYPHNQWYLEGPTIPMGHHEYRPLSEMLVEVADRYKKPIMISETGAEGTGKPSWLHYVCDEVRQAMNCGAAIRGICWYPITAYPGWDNSRHAEAGLLSTVTSDGERNADERLYAEFVHQREMFGLSPSTRRAGAADSRN